VGGTLFPGRKLAGCVIERAHVALALASRANLIANQETNNGSCATPHLASMSQNIPERTNDIARNSATQSSHFARDFRRCSGMTTYRWRELCRWNRGERMEFGRELRVERRQPRHAEEAPATAAPVRADFVAGVR